MHVFLRFIHSGIKEIENKTIINAVVEIYLFSEKEQQRFSVYTLLIIAIAC